MLFETLLHTMDSKAWEGDNVAVGDAVVLWRFRVANETRHLEGAYCCPRSLSLAHGWWDDSSRLAWYTHIGTQREREREGEEDRERERERERAR